MLHICKNVLHWDKQQKRTQHYVFTQTSFFGECITSKYLPRTASLKKNSVKSEISHTALWTLLVLMYMYIFSTEFTSRFLTCSGLYFDRTPSPWNSSKTSFNFFVESRWRKSVTIKNYYIAIYLLRRSLQFVKLKNDYKQSLEHILRSCKSHGAALFIFKDIKSAFS